MIRFRSWRARYSLTWRFISWRSTSCSASEMQGVSDSSRQRRRAQSKGRGHACLLPIVATNEYVRQNMKDTPKAGALEGAQRAVAGPEADERIGEVSTDHRSTTKIAGSYVRDIERITVKHQPDLLGRQVHRFVHLSQNSRERRRPCRRSFRLDDAVVHDRHCGLTRVCAQSLVAGRGVTQR